MSVWQLVMENPTIEQLSARFPHLRRFCGNFHTDKALHQTDKVGLVNDETFQRLRVSLVNGDVEVA